MRLKIIKTDNTNPYENLAAEEYLTFHAEDDEVILYLWQNAHTVVIGRNQNPWRECNVERIKQEGVYLARRMSGGGAVYHDMGNLNFTFVAKDGLFDVGRQTDIILVACRIMGINAQISGRNDLLINEKKFSGHAYFSSNGYNYHHGTIMVNVNGDDMPKYLQVSEAKLKSKGVASVRSRVTNIIDHIPESKMNEICGGRATTGGTVTGELVSGQSATRESAPGESTTGALAPGQSTTENLTFEDLTTEEKMKLVVAAMADAMVQAASREYGCKPVPADAASAAGAISGSTVGAASSPAVGAASSTAATASADSADESGAILSPEVGALLSSAADVASTAAADLTSQPQQNILVYEELPQIPQESIDRYTSEEWRLGTRIPFSKVIEHRFDWGGVTVEMEMRGEYIADIRIYSDSLETEMFGILEDLLRGCRYDASEILGLRLPHGVTATAYEILELIASSIE